jgi:hypothetical protein
MIISTQPYTNGLIKEPKILLWNIILSGEHIGKFATSENALIEFPEIFENLDYEIVDLDSNVFQVDYTPPTPIGYKILIPEYWEALFPEDKFIIGGFEAQLERKNNSLVVDVAYLQWTSFRQELLKPENSTLARQMGAVMRYLEQQALNKDFV